MATPEFDIIIYGTGFKASEFLFPMKVYGLDGIELQDKWDGDPKAYKGVTIPGFPNLFMLNGPNGPVGNFTLVDIAEHQWGYIAQLIERLRNGQAREISPTAEAMDSFEQARSEAARKTVWYTGGCQSWYLDVDGIPASWPWTYSRFVDMMAAPDISAFDVRS